MKGCSSLAAGCHQYETTLECLALSDIFISKIRSTMAAVKENERILIDLSSYRCSSLYFETLWKFMLIFLFLCVELFVIFHNLSSYSWGNQFFSSVLWIGCVCLVRFFHKPFFLPWKRGLEFIKIKLFYWKMRRRLTRKLKQCWINHFNQTHKSQ